MALYSRPTTWAKAMFVVVVNNLFFLVFYERLRIFFSVLTFGLLGKTSRLHNLVAVIREFSDLNIRFFQKHGLEFKQNNNFPLIFTIEC